MDLKTYKAKSEALYADITKVLEQHGFNLGKVSAGVDPLDGTVRLTLMLKDANLKDASGNTTTPEALRFTRNAGFLGMKPEWLGQQFKVGIESYTVTGLRDGRAKNIVIVRRDRDSSNRTAPVDFVKNAFELAELRAKKAVA